MLPVGHGDGPSVPDQIVVWPEQLSEAVQDDSSVGVVVTLPNEDRDTCPRLLVNERGVIGPGKGITVVAAPLREGWKTEGVKTDVIASVTCELVELPGTSGADDAGRDSADMGHRQS